MRAGLCHAATVVLRHAATVDLQVVVILFSLFPVVETNSTFMHEYITLLREHPQFRTLWIARLVSNLGDWFNLLASAALVQSLTNSGMAVSGLFLARFIPTFLATPFAGVIADRVSRRTIMLAADVLRFATVLCFLFVRDASQIWLFYVLTALQFIFSAFYGPAHSAIIANVVPKERLVAANTLDALSWSVMLSIGALLGGVATALLGVQMAFILDALTFLVSAYFVSRIHIVYANAGVGEGEHANTGGWLAFRDGLNYLRLRPYLLVIALVKAGGAVIWGVVNVLEIPMSNTDFAIRGSGALTLGIVYALIGIGTGVGPLLIGKLTGRGSPQLLRGIGISFVVFTIGVLWVGLANNTPGFLAAISLRGLGSGALWVFSSVLLQSFVQDHFRGRVFGFELAALTLAESVGTIYGGVSIDNWGMTPSQAVLLIGGVSVFVTIGWYIFQQRAIGALANERSFATPRVRAEAAAD